MTAEEQLAAWAAAPNDEVFITVRDIGNAVEAPYVIGRLKAGDALAALQGKIGALPGIARDVLARFYERTGSRDSMRVTEINGVTCVIVEGRAPNPAHTPYTMLLSAVAAFS